MPFADRVLRLADGQLAAHATPQPSEVVS
jgi:hypothetical protein